MSKLSLALLVLTAPPSIAQITTVGPFVGDISEGFETQPAQITDCVYPRVFAERGDVCSAGGPFISVAHSFGQLTPHSGTQCAASDLGGAVISFDAPVQAFGGYFAGYGLTVGLAQFFDVSGNLIGEQTWSVPQCTGACAWVWNGYDAGNGPRISSVRMVETGPAPGGPFMDDLVALVGAPQTGTFFCNAAGSLHPCPCNSGGFFPPRGCPTAYGNGARLAAGGVASLSADSVELYASGMGPATSVLFFQGTALAPGDPSFGGGLRCVGGTLVRVGTHPAVNGTAHYPSLGDPALHVRGQVTSPGVRMYQVDYRDTYPACTGVQPFNLSNGYQILWVP